MAMRFGKVAITLAGPNPRRQKAVEGPAPHDPALAGGGPMGVDGGRRRVFPLPITRPFPHVTHDVQQTIPRFASGKRNNRSGGGKAAFFGIHALSTHAHIDTVFHAPCDAFFAASVHARAVGRVVAPWIATAIGAAGGEFPFGLGRQALVSPRTVT